MLTKPVSQVPYGQFLVKWGKSTKFFLMHPVVLSFDFRVGAARARVCSLIILDPLFCKKRRLYGAVIHGAV